MILGRFGQKKKNRNKDIKNMEKKITVVEIIYFIYFGIMFGARAAGLYESLLLYNISLVLGALFFVLKLAVTEYSRFEYMIIFALLGISLLVYHNTGEKGFLLYMTMMLGMKGVSLRRIEKWALTVMSVCFTVTVLLSVSGLKEDIAYPADARFFFVAVMRRCLGYPFFNTMFTTYIIFIILIMLVVRFDNIKALIITSAFLYSFALYFYIYTCSNTGLIVTTLYLFLNLLVYNRKKINRVAKVVIQMIYPSCLIFSILGPLCITGYAFAKLDEHFHNRFNYARYYLTTEPITLFGVRFGPGLNDNYQVDSSFLYSFLQVGIVPCIILTFLMMLMIHDVVVNNRMKELAVIISFCVLGMSDPFFYNLSYKNLLFLFVADLLFNKWIPFCESKLPSILSKKTSMFKIGCKEVDYSKVSEIYKKIGLAFNNVVDSNGIIHFVIFAVLFAVISQLSYIISDSSILIAAVDTPDEWEYVRSISSVAIWTSLILVILFSNCVTKEHK